MIGIFEHIEVGTWYQAPGGEPFEIVALDLEAETIEIQYYDGAIEEVEFDSWLELSAQRTTGPDNASGAFDMAREDIGIDFGGGGAREDYSNPLDQLDWS